MVFSNAATSGLALQIVGWEIAAEAGFVDAVEFAVAAEFAAQAAAALSAKTHEAAKTRIRMGGISGSEFLSTAKYNGDPPPSVQLRIIRRCRCPLGGVVGVAGWRGGRAV